MCSTLVEDNVLILPCQTDSTHWIPQNIAHIQRDTPTGKYFKHFLHKFNNRALRHITITSNIKLQCAIELFERRYNNKIIMDALTIYGTDVTFSFLLSEQILLTFSQNSGILYFCVVIWFHYFLLLFGWIFSFTEILHVFLFIHEIFQMISFISIFRCWQALKWQSDMVIILLKALVILTWIPFDSWICIQMNGEQF